MPHSLPESFAYAKAVRDEVFRLTEGMTLPKTGGRSNVLHAFVSVAIEHQRAIIVLTEARLHGSAQAIERLLVEAVLRGLWVNRCATEGQVLAIGQHDAQPYPKFKQLCQIVDDKYAAEGYFSSLAQVWRSLCSYTHSGLEQLSRRFARDGVMPNYTDQEIATLLDRSTSYLLALLLPWFVEMELQDSVKTLASLLEAHTTSSA